MAENFIKVKEDFQCEYCGILVKGNGYTNHCPKCLWSKHVDVVPGDRASKCGGLMKPEEMIKMGEEFIIKHKCLDCGYEKPNKTSASDDITSFLTEMI